MHAEYRLGVDDLTRDLFLAQDGDLEAFTRVVRSSESDIRRFCTWLTGPPSDVDDLVQETLLRAFRGLDSFRGDSPGMSWILTIARRVCLDNSRVKARQQRNSILMRNDRLQSATTSGQSSFHALADLVKQLPEPLRESFVLVRVL
jgi:RNA polymerase sigma-70 factor (ECF subfamily)